MVAKVFLRRRRLPDLAPMLIDYALTQCITERRPVYIELLEDVVDLECQPPMGRLQRARRFSDQEGLKESVAAHVTALMGA